MARTVRNAKLDTRSARAKLPGKKSGYWVPITRGFALGYRKGPKGSVWLARLIDGKCRREAALGPAHAALAEAPARLRTRKTAKRQNVRDIDLEDPNAVRQRRASANRIFGVLKAALNLAFREGYAATDKAWRRVKPFREASAPKIRYLSHAEAQRLVNACEADLRPLVQCALLTGCRYGEIVGFSAVDFDRDAGTVSVRASKAGRPRHVVLTDDGIALFEQHVAGKAGTAPVFTRPDGARWGRSHQHRPLREACSRAGIDPPASFHILRHTYATHLLQAGAPLPVIAANLGHSDTRMTERHYAHLVPSHIAQVIRATMPKLGLVQPGPVVLLGSALTMVPRG